MYLKVFIHKWIQIIQIISLHRNNRTKTNSCPFILMILWWLEEHHQMGWLQTSEWLQRLMNYLHKPHKKKIYLKYFVLIALLFWKDLCEPGKVKKIYLKMDSISEAPVCQILKCGFYPCQEMLLYFQNTWCVVEISLSMVGSYAILLLVLKIRIY